MPSVQRESYRTNRIYTKHSGSDFNYQSKEWRKFRKQYLQTLNIDGLCEVERENNQRYINGYALDHIKPVSLWPELAWHSSNMQFMSRSLHQRKSRIERDIKSRTEWIEVMSRPENKALISIPKLPIELR